MKVKVKTSGKLTLNNGGGPVKDFVKGEVYEGETAKFLKESGWADEVDRVINAKATLDKMVETSRTKGEAKRKLREWAKAEFNHSVKTNQTIPEMIEEIWQLSTK